MRVRRRHLYLYVGVIALLGFGLLGTATAFAHESSRQTAKHHPVKHKKKTPTKHHKGVAKPAAPGSSPAVRDIPVTFSVVNSNTSDVPCTANGDTYTIAGTLVLPAGAVPKGVTLYVHGLGFGSYFWDFTAVPGYDYVATEAKDGHASLTIDRLGYGSSSIPNGDDTCVGSQATILHEVVQDLRSGNYHATGTPAQSFSRVGLVGHSVGGALVETEAYSYNDINALGVVEWNDADYSVGTYAAFASDITQCLSGGEDQVGSSTAGYARFGETDAEYNSLMFAGVAPNVEAAADKLRTLDPCGLIASVLTGVAENVLHDSSIKVPIIYFHASEDAIFPIGIPWAAVQETLYTHTAKLTDVSLPGAGHAVTLESASAAPFAAAMNSWLTANGL
jgi:pimeloyl-ACP methyl ester carboxylesterase